VTDRSGERSHLGSLCVGLCLAAGIAVAITTLALGQRESAGAQVRAPQPRALKCTATARARPVKSTGGNSTLITVVCDGAVAYLKFRGSPIGSSFNTANPIWGPTGWAVSSPGSWVAYSTTKAAPPGQKLRFLLYWAPEQLVAGINGVAAGNDHGRRGFRFTVSALR